MKNGGAGAGEEEGSALPRSGVVNRISWTFPAMLAGLLAMVLWYVGLSFVKGVDSFLMSLEQGVTAGVLILLPGWVLVILPVVLIFKETSWVYSFRHAWWFGALCGILMWGVIVWAMVPDDPGWPKGVREDVARRTAMTAPAALLVGAVVGMTIVWSKRKWPVAR